MPGSLHIFFKIPKIGSVFDCLALLSKKVNKLLCDILVTWSPKTSKNQVIKWDEKLNSQASMVSKLALRSLVPRVPGSSPVLQQGNWICHRSVQTIGLLLRLSLQPLSNAGLQSPDIFLGSGAFKKF